MSPNTMVYIEKGGAHETDLKKTESNKPSLN